MRPLSQCSQISVLMYRAVLPAQYVRRVLQLSGISAAILELEAFPHDCLIKSVMNVSEDRSLNEADTVSK